jgi:UDPglucose 6-dehydrogenase
VSLASQWGTRAALAEATHQANQQEISWLTELIRSRLPAGGRVGLLGMSYKPKTDIAEASTGLLVARQLTQAGVAVTIYDPEAMASARKDLGDLVRYADSFAACAGESDVLVITTPWDEFRALAPSDLKRVTPRPTVIDCWRILDAARFKDAANVLVVGMGPVVTAAVQVAGD